MEPGLRKPGWVVLLEVVTPPADRTASMEPGLRKPGWTRDEERRAGWVPLASMEPGLRKPGWDDLVHVCGRGVVRASMEPGLRKPGWVAMAATNCWIPASLLQWSPACGSRDGPSKRAVFETAPAALQWSPACGSRDGRDPLEHVRPERMELQWSPACGSRDGGRRRHRSEVGVREASMEPGLRKPGWSLGRACAPCLARHPCFNGARLAEAGMVGSTKNWP